MASSSRKKKVFFLHVPKCGGTSIDNAFKRKFRSSQIFRLNAPPSAVAAEVYFEGTDTPTSQYYHVLKLREALMLYGMSDKKHRYVSGHFCFSENGYRRFGDEFAFATILRDPVKRWISHYFYNRYKTREEQHCQVEQDIQAILDSERGRSWGTEYVKYYGGLRTDGDYRSDASIERAIANIDRFDVVGTLENLGAFTKEVQKTLGLGLHVRKTNTSPVSPELKKQILTDDVMIRIRDVCAPDTRIYESARKR